MNRMSVLPILIFAAATPVLAVFPPPAINYQGVLRDAAGNPVNGTRDMRFNFYDAPGIGCPPSGGANLFIDEHSVSGTGAVTVTGGLFNVQLGTGDTSGVVSFLELFRGAGVWMEIVVAGETLCPRVEMLSSPYAINAWSSSGISTPGWSVDAQGSIFSFVSNSGVPHVAATLLDSGDLQIDGDLTVSGGDISLGAKSITTSTDAFNLNLGRLGIGSLQDFNGSPSTTPTHMATVGTHSGEDGIRLIGSGAFGSGARVEFGDRFGATQRVFLQEDLDDNLLVSVPLGRVAIAATNVGIGTTTPTDKLHVIGSFRATGTKNFVQNHPGRRDQVIVYTALEGDEAGTYTRGSGRLRHGVARVPLGETFRWVTDPEIGLTAQLTARGAWADLYVESVTTEELVVRSRDGASSDAAFDYAVYGLRLGYEGHRVVQSRAPGEDASLPPEGYFEAKYPGQDDLRSFTALERFRRIEAEVFGKHVGDGSQARALRIAAGQFELQHALPIQAPKSLAARTALAPPRQVDANPIDAPLDPKPHAGEYPEPFAASRLTTLLGAAEPVETGDLLVVDPARPDSVLRARDAEDRRVLGVAVSNTGPDGSRVEVALSGVTLCKVDAAYGPVQPGDLLTSSPTLGHAMRSDSPRPGSLVGKALEPLESGTGVIRIAVTLH